MGRLEGQIAYLCGPIDNAPDLGKEWRKSVEFILKKRFGCGVLNPQDKSVINASSLNEDEDIIKLAVDAINSENYDSASALMKSVVRADLSMVDHAHFLFTYLDRDIYTFGSVHELVIASMQRKPCIIVCKQGKKLVPRWCWGFLNHNLFFGSFEEAFTYLEYVDSSTDYLKFWRFFNREKIYATDKNSLEWADTLESAIPRIFISPK